MAVAFYIPSVDEDEQVKPNQAYQQQQQQQQQQPQPQEQQQSGAGSNVSQQVCSAEVSQQHLMLLFHEILITYAREAVLAQQAAAVPSPSPCLLCKKLYYLFRRIY